MVSECNVLAADLCNDVKRALATAPVPISLPGDSTACSHLMLCAEQKGRVVVERIQDGSNAALGGLQIGDRIRGTTARSKVPYPPSLRSAL